MWLERARSYPANKTVLDLVSGDDPAVGGCFVQRISSASDAIPSHGSAADSSNSATLSFLAPRILGMDRGGGGFYFSLCGTVCKTFGERAAGEK